MNSPCGILVVDADASDFTFLDTLVLLSAMLVMRTSGNGETRGLPGKKKSD